MAIIFSGNESGVLTFSALLTLMGRQSRTLIYDLMRCDPSPLSHLIELLPHLLDVLKQRDVNQGGQPIGKSILGMARMSRLNYPIHRILDLEC